MPLNALPYVVKPGETLASIAAQFPHLPSWYTLVTYNNLEHPYLVATPQEREGKATGEVTFYPRGNVPVGITIPRNTLVGFEREGKRYTYRTIQDVTFSSSPVTATVEALQSGSAFNVPSKTIDTIFDSSLASIFTVTNLSPLSGGFRKNVLTYGEILFIPFPESTTTLIPTPEDLYGKDIFVFDNLSPNHNDFALTPHGDLATVEGIDNLKQALIRRILTEKGSLPKHPEYGSQLRTAIGNAIATQVPQFISLEVIRTLKNDPRVLEVRNVRTEIRGDAAMVSCQVVINTDTSISLDLEVPLP